LSKSQDFYKKYNIKKFSPDTQIGKATVKLLQECLRIDTTNPPGNEITLAKILKEKVDALNCEYIENKIIEPVPKRGNLVITIKGKAPEDHPSWGFMAHLDVVPVEGEWEHGPFSGEITTTEHSRYIWGRGAFDMKQMGVAFFMAMTQLIQEGFRPKGDLKIIFEADEERGGHEGAELLAKDYYEEVKVDCVVTEGGGFKLPTGGDFAIQRGEKGKCQLKVKVKGTPGHGSLPPPYKEFAIYKLVEILEQICTRKIELYLDDLYYELIEALSIPKVFKFFLKKKSLIPLALSLGGRVTHVDLKRIFIPMVSDVISPTVIKSGVKENVISPEGEVILDIRTLPEHDKNYILNYIHELIGTELYEQLEFEEMDVIDGTTTPIDTPYYRQIEETLKEMFLDANLVPILGTGGTDMKHMRPKGIICYGFVPMVKDPDLTYNEYMGLAHAPNERISELNLLLASEFSYHLMKKI